MRSGSLSIPRRCTPTCRKRPGCADTGTSMTFKHARVEEEPEKFDFIVSRAVMPLSDLVKLTTKNVKKAQQNALPNGLICLKGGELEHEIQPYKKNATLYDLSDWFDEEFFKTKKAVYLPL